MLIFDFESEKIAGSLAVGWGWAQSRQVGPDYNGPGSLFTENKKCPPLSDARLDFLRLTHFRVKNIDLHSNSISSLNADQIAD